jgi:hypothetical protein
MTNSLALRIEDASFATTIRSIYDATRADALAALERNQADPNSDAYKRALELVRDGRRRVAESFRRTGGSAAPQQQAAWFWEEYEKSGGGTEFLVFVRFDGDSDALRSLIAEYTTIGDHNGTKLVTAYPQLAWKLPGVVAGSFVVDPGPLAARGLAPGDVITAVAGQEVRNTVDVIAHLKTAGPHAPLTVLSTKDGAARTIE